MHIGKYDYEYCKIIALNYITRKELRENHLYIYVKINKNKWYDLFTHMIKVPSKINIKWTLENCITEAAKYTSTAEMRRNSTSALHTICRRGWESQCFKHFTKTSYRTFNECFKIANKYSTRGDFFKYDSAVYKYTKRKGWFNKCVQHMK